MYKRVTFTTMVISLIMANAQIQVLFVPNERGGESLVYNDKS